MEVGISYPVGCTSQPNYRKKVIFGDDLLLKTYGLWRLWGVQVQRGRSNFPLISGCPSKDSDISLIQDVTNDVLPCPYSSRNPTVPFAFVQHVKPCEACCRNFPYLQLGSWEVLAVAPMISP